MFNPSKTFFLSCCHNFSIAYNACCRVVVIGRDPEDKSGQEILDLVSKMKVNRLEALIMASRSKTKRK